MTKRDVFTKAYEMFAEGSEEREVMAKAIAQLDKRASKPTKAQVANQGIKGEIAEALATFDEPQPAKAIAEAVGYTTPKVSALLRQLVAEGTVTKYEGKGKNPATYERAQALTGCPPLHWERGWK